MVYVCSTHLHHVEDGLHGVGQVEHVHPLGILSFVPVSTLGLIG